MGDSGTGKSSLIRQLLLQIRIRGEGAVVYDPALEFLPQFYDPISDTVLNPTDTRMPFWTPSDEVQYPAEAAAIADSLFPDRPRDNNFFTEAARKIFAHLLRYRPTPQELTHWMKNMDEVDQRVAQTELEAMIQKNAERSAQLYKPHLTRQRRPSNFSPANGKGKDDGVQLSGPKREMAGFSFPLCPCCEKAFGRCLVCG
jgi:Type IV secretion-system coupling protein DNA-binding domain